MDASNLALPNQALTDLLAPSQVPPVFLKASNLRTLLHGILSHWLPGAKYW